MACAQPGALADEDTPPPLPEAGSCHGLRVGMAVKVHGLTIRTLKHLNGMLICYVSASTLGMSPQPQYATVLRPCQIEGRQGRAAVQPVEGDGYAKSGAGVGIEIQRHSFQEGITRTKVLTVFAWHIKFGYPVLFI
eukprot:SAG31_NODE_611_length_13558_cov_224.959730_2_plen_136_part_00